MIKTLLIGFGGFIGAISRYYTSLIITKMLPMVFPVGTLIINLIGAFVIGLITEFSLKVFPLNNNLLAFITVGILGGFTTFSTFSLETVNLFEAGKYNLTMVNIFASVALCLIGVMAGKFVARLFA